jgi:nitrate reductase NapE component
VVETKGETATGGWNKAGNEPVTSNMEAHSRNHCRRRKAIIITYLFFAFARVPVRAYVCVGARGRGNVLARVWPYLSSMQRVRALLSSAASVAPINSLTCHKRYDFRGKELLNLKCVFLFSLQLLSKTFLILRRVQRDIVIIVKTSSCKVRVILVGF